ncbi:putative transposase [Oscillibacter valericigenes Sjm18-20]|nr:putative transposase [Oscillibacter valericigenes Sjm18-20]BAK98812.1 putative transposase [Oscillibacter valericigenes Sjm18-20]BAL00560.1 putative transposase [Oscillibacter valericigenes Sjm18-20]
MVIQGLRQTFSLDILLEIAQLPRSTCYYHTKRLAGRTKAAYGYRRITAAFRQQGFVLNHKTVHEGVRADLSCTDEKASFLQG